MKAQIKLISNNGHNPIEVFNSIKELKLYLNECLYYANELYLNIECNYSDNWEYSKITDLRSLLSEAKFYGSILCVNVEY